MARQVVTLTVTFDSLVEAITRLSLEDKCRLLTILDEQIGLAEEARFAHDPRSQAELENARAAYGRGDYVTFEEYMQGRRSSE